MPNTNPIAVLLLIPAFALADDIAPLSDEFDAASTFANWQDLGIVEGWNTPPYYVADPTEVPNRSFSLTGIFAHGPRPGITQAATDPYTTAAVTSAGGTSCGGG